MDKKVRIIGGVEKRVLSGNPVSEGIWPTHRITHRIILRLNNVKISYDVHLRDKNRRKKP